jgi:hypothetical protein
MRGSATGLVVGRRFQTCVHQFVMPGIDGYDEEERVVVVVGWKGQRWSQAV